VRRRRRLTRAGVESMHVAARDVDEVEATAALVPHRRLPEREVRVQRDDRFAAQSA
jgi:hypothetical protein